MVVCGVSILCSMRGGDDGYLGAGGLGRVDAGNGVLENQTVACIDAKSLGR